MNVFAVTMIVLMLVEAGIKLAKCVMTSNGHDVSTKQTAGGYLLEFCGFLGFGIWGLVELLK